MQKSISVTRNLRIDINPVIPQDEDFADAPAWLSTQMKKQYSLKMALKTNNIQVNFDDSLRVLLIQAVMFL